VGGETRVKEEAAVMEAVVMAGAVMTGAVMVGAVMGAAYPEGVARIRLFVNPPLEAVDLPPHTPLHQGVGIG
jgi:hypothetical protein